MVAFLPNHPAITIVTQGIVDLLDSKGRQGLGLGGLVPNRLCKRHHQESDVARIADRTPVLNVRQSTWSEFHNLFRIWQELVKVIHRILVKHAFLCKSVQKHMQRAALFIPRVLCPRFGCRIVPLFGSLQPFGLLGRSVNPCCTPCQLVLVARRWVPERRPLVCILFGRYVAAWVVRRKLKHSLCTVHELIRERPVVFSPRNRDGSHRRTVLPEISEDGLSGVI